MLIEISESKLEMLVSRTRNDTMRAKPSIRSFFCDITRTQQITTRSVLSRITHGRII